MRSGSAFSVAWSFEQINFTNCFVNQFAKRDQSVPRSKSRTPCEVWPGGRKLIDARRRDTLTALSSVDLTDLSVIFAKVCSNIVLASHLDCRTKNLSGKSIE
jgi:hypothetical protein